MMMRSAFRSLGQDLKSIALALLIRYDIRTDSSQTYSSTYYPFNNAPAIICFILAFTPNANIKIIHNAASHAQHFHFPIISSYSLPQSFRILALVPSPYSELDYDFDNPPTFYTPSTKHHSTAFPTLAHLQTFYQLPSSRPH